MASRSRSKARRGGKVGGNGPVGMIVGLLLVAVFVSAFFKIPAHQSVDGTRNFFADRAKTVELWISSWSDDPIGYFTGGKAPSSGGSSTGSSDPAGSSPNGGSGGTGIAAPVDAATSTAQLGAVVIADAEKVSYNRDEWKHWNNVSTCWTVREQALFRQAEPGTAVLLDKDKNATADPAAACEITGGTWIDPYTGKTFTDPSKLDIDHMVPLKYTATHGGQAWDANKKAEYANSLADGHLLAVSASANRSKSDKGPSNWVPQDSFKCQYAKNWISVSTQWGLTNTAKDVDVLTSMLQTCPA